MKVLMVGITSGLGGVENFICNISELLVKRGVQVDFLVHQTPDPRIMKRINDINSNLYYVKGIKRGIFSFWRDITKFYKKHQYDIVHIHECGPSFSIYILPILLKKNTKIIVHSHNGDGKKLNILAKILKKIQNKKADGFWACSEVAADWLFNKNIISSEKYSLIYNGIDINKYSFSLDAREKIRKEFNLVNKLVFGSVARFERQKNHYFMIDMFNEYQKNDENSVLLLIGEGTLKNEIQNKVIKLGIEKKVLFLGLKNNVNEFMSAFDVFLLPSLFEGLPFVGIEAQAAACPLLVSNTVSEQLKITKLVNYFDLNSSMEEIVNNMDVRLSLSERLSDIYTKDIREKGYSLVDTVNKIYEKYVKIINYRKD